MAASLEILKPVRNNQPFQGFILNRLNQYSRWDNPNYEAVQGKSFDESVAAHTEDVLRIANVWIQEIQDNDQIDSNGIDFGRVVDMLWIHDLHEGINGDISIYTGKTKDDKQREKGEYSTMLLMAGELNNYHLGLFDEFEEQETPEAIFAKIIDRVAGSNYFIDTQGRFEEWMIEHTWSRIQEVQDLSAKIFSPSLHGFISAKLANIFVRQSKPIQLQQAA